MRLSLFICCLVCVSVTSAQKPDKKCIQCLKDNTKMSARCQRYCVSGPSTLCQNCVKMGSRSCVEACSKSEGSDECQCLNYCARDPSSYECMDCIKMECPPSGLTPGMGGSAMCRCMYNCARDPSSNGCMDCLKMVCFRPGMTVSCGAMITRRNVTDIKHEEFAEYSNILGRVKNVQGPTGFASIGQYHGLHGYYPPGEYFCNADQTKYPANYTQNGCCINHWGQDDRIDLFTPWHRLYMANMEWAFRLESLSKPLAIPYWDWTNANTPGLPSLAKYGEWINGPILGQPGVVTHRNPTPIPYDQLQRQVKTSYMQTTFCEFNFHIVQPHNTIHNKVGGNMATIGYSSYDPIFYLHHSYVDSQYAYFQELQKIRNKENTFKNPNFRMQPFDRDTNPYSITKLFNTGPETEDYKGHFCYEYDTLKFMGMSPQEFIHYAEEERKKPSLFAAHLLKTTKITSTLKFDLLPKKSEKYEYIGTLTTFGTKDTDPDYSEPEIHETLLYDVTDLLNDPENEPNDKTLTFQMSKYTDSANNDLDIKETYKPVVVFRAADSDTHVYRFHEDYIQDYPPKIEIKLGSKIEFLKADGSYSSSAYEILSNTNGTEKKELVTGEFSIQKLEHKFIIGTSYLSVGYAVGCLINCINGVPINLDPGYLSVIPWNDEINNGHFNIRYGEHVMLAWCPLTDANVYKFADETDYNDCNIPDGHDDDNHKPDDLRGYLIDTTSFGTQYFANGVGDACKNGWKITVDVFPLQ